MQDTKPTQPRKKPQHLWKPGQSGNPKGRTPSGYALAETIRKVIGPQEITKFLEELVEYAHDRTIPIEKRSPVVLPWLDRGYLKPPATVAVQVESAGYDWSALPADMQASVMAAFAGQVAAAALPSPTEEVLEAEIVDVDKDTDG